MPNDLTAFRQSYHLGSLRRHQLNPDPFHQFEKWFAQAVDAVLQEPNAMILSTSTPDGIPSSRVVLLKDVNSDGFSFFTNYNSRKGREIASDPNVSLLFLWLPLERQVRIEGAAHKLTESESDAYFHSRPAGSRLGAWASEQSSIVADRKTLENRLKEFENKWTDGAIPRPNSWGGYRVKPHLFEFWQGRDNRLHDRFRYTLSQHEWIIHRLAP
jgi:pyridoxamine 5'-phosphate oxidase